MATTADECARVYSQTVAVGERDAKDRIVLYFSGHAEISEKDNYATNA